MINVLALVGFLILALIIWAWIAVRRGASQRDDKLAARLAPIGRKIDAGEAVSSQEVAALAAHPEIRFMLFSALRQMKKPELFPTTYSSSVAQGESALAYWMMHPNELQDAPELIEWIETSKRHVEGREAEFHVFRYRMPAGHWATKQGWILGVAGPMSANSEPYAELPGAFSRVSDMEGKITPTDLIDWYVGMLRQRGLIK